MWFKAWGHHDGIGRRYRKWDINKENFRLKAKKY